MLKSIVNGAEHDIVSIPMKGKNLFDKSIISLNAYPSVSNIISPSPNTRTTYAPCMPNTTYTISKIQSERFIVAYTKTIPAIGEDFYGVITNNEATKITITTGNDASYLVIFYYHASYDSLTENEIKDSIMINLGSKALPYEPYGYQNGWEVRDNQDRLIWGREDELQTTTGTLPFKGYGLPVKVKSLLGNGVQNGTPTPDAPIVPEFCGVRTENLYFKKIEGANISDSGVITALSGFDLYIAKVEQGIQYTGNGYVYAFFEDEPVIGSISFDSSRVVDSFRDIASPINGFVAVRNPDTIQNAMCNTGQSLLPFEPYGYKISFDNNGKNLWDKGVPKYVYANDYKKYNPDNAIVLKAGTYTISSDGKLPIIQVFDMNHIQLNVDDTITYTSGYYTLWDGLAIGPQSGVFHTITITLLSDYILTFVVSDNLGTYLMLNSGSTALPYSPYLNKTTPIYLGEVPTIRRIKCVDLGTLTYTKTNSGNFGANLGNGKVVNNSQIAPAICSHFKVVSANNYNSTPYSLCASINNQSYISINKTGFEEMTAEEFKSAMSGVLLWYALNIEQTGIVNEPLAKIGDYADELTTIKVNGLSAPLYGIGDYKDILNLSTGVITRKIKKLVLTGEEISINKRTSPENSYSFSIGGNGWPSSTVGYGTSSHFVRNGTVATLIDGEFYVGSTAFSFRLDDCTDVAAFRQYLAAQYAAGTPITVWYVLSEPETETVSIPTGMTGEIEGYLTQISTPTPEHPSIPKWNGKEETGGTYAVTVYTPPEIPTTVGQNKITVDTDLAPYDVTIDGHIRYTYWGKIREDVRSGLAQTKFPVGTILYDNEDETTGRAFQVVGYDKHFDPSLTARGYTHSMTLCQLNLSGPWQFDATEAFLYTTVEMQPGTYKFKIPNYDTAYGGNKTYYFTSTASVPVDSQITLSWAYQQLPSTVTAYAGPNPQTKTTAITGFNALQLSEWVEGESPEAIDLGTIKLSNNDPDSAYGKLNHIHRARYGSNNYYQSGLRQLLNTDLAENNWWHPTTIFDRPYGSRSINGYLRSLNEDFVNVLATPEITHITNNIFEYPSLDGRTFTLNTEYKINTDKVFLLSHTEVGLSATPNIGTLLDYYNTHNTNDDRIKHRIDNGVAYSWWLRTPYPTYAHYFRNCNASGALSNNNADRNLGVAPAHIIQ